jgi:RNA polymerase sigma-70 factor (ECF subfamily)
MDAILGRADVQTDVHAGVEVQAAPVLPRKRGRPPKQVVPPPTVAVLKTMTDEALGTLAARGSEQAWSVLYDRMTPRLLQAAMVRVHQADTADDLVQETMVKAWNSRAQYNPVHPYRSWVHTILAHLSTSLFRRDQAFGRVLTKHDTHGGAGVWCGEAFADAETLLDRSDAAARLAPILAQLTARERAVILAWAEGGAPVDIAKVAGDHPGTIRAVLCRARQKLGEVYRATYPQEVMPHAVLGLLADLDVVA